MQKENGELDVFNITVPLYATYLKLVFLLPLGFLIMVLSSMVIFAILKDKKLRTNNNLLVVNLLVSDIVFILLQLSHTVYLASIYLLDLEWDDFCNAYLPVASIMSRITTLMTIPLIAYRVVSIARPFSYKRIMTKEKIVSMIIALWVFAAVSTVLITVSIRLTFVPSFLACVTTGNHSIALIAFFVPEMFAFTLLLFASAYLRYKIIKSNRFINGVQRSASDREKAVRVGRLVKALMEQVKPTLSVLIIGGIDGLFDLLLAVALGSLYNQTSSVMLYYGIDTATILLFYCQLLTHPLCFGLYNPEIREKLSRPACYPQPSRVIVLNARP